MDKLSYRRRQFLLYLGLGVAGAGAATALGLSSQKNNLTAAMPSSSRKVGITSPDQLAATEAVPKADATEVAALPPGSRALPEFQGISQWLNSAPLSTSDLKGNVV